MLIAAIAESERETSGGPFQELFERIARLERDVDSMRTKTHPYYDPHRYTGTNPTWVSTTGIGWPSSYSVTTSSAGTTTNAVGTSTISEEEITKLLQDLKTDMYWTKDEVSSLEKAYKEANGN